MEIRLDIKTAVANTLAWVVARVGEPDPDFQTSRPGIPYPDLKVPVNKGHKIHESLATVRYPLVDYGLSKLIQPYDLVVSRLTLPDAESGLDVSVPTQMLKYLPMAPWRSRYLFGEGVRKAERQLAEFAYRMAIMTNELFRLPLVASGNDYYVTCGGKPTFGIKSGRLIGVKDYRLSIPEKESITPSVIEKHVGNNMILCLYDRAESFGEYEAMFAIQAAVWLNGKSAVTLQSALERKYPSMSGRSSRMPGRPRKSAPKTVISSTVYHQALNIINGTDNPRQELYNLLVPWAVTARYYRAHFSNVSITSNISNGMRQKMLDALHQLYIGS
jgi:hypothetical protein